MCTAQNVHFPMFSISSLHRPCVCVVPHCHLDTKSPYLSGGLIDLLGLILAMPMSLLDEDCVLLAGGFAFGGDVTFGMSGVTGKSGRVLSSSDVVGSGSIYNWFWFCCWN